jgi:hypothetical protein
MKEIFYGLCFVILLSCYSARIAYEMNHDCSSFQGYPQILIPIGCINELINQPTQKRQPIKQ